MRCVSTQESMLSIGMGQPREVLCTSARPSFTLRVPKAVCEEGYEWFGFNPGGGHEGVKAFEKGFGTETLRCPAVIYKHRAAKY